MTFPKPIDNNIHIITTYPLTKSIVTFYMSEGVYGFNMTQAVLRQRPRRVEVPDGLHSTHAKLVYVYLHLAESATIDELTEDLCLSQLNVLPVIQHLAENDLARRDGESVRLVR